MISFLAAGSVSTGTTSLTPGSPAGLGANDLQLLGVVNKYPTNGPATPSGWTLVAQYDLTGRSPGADNGNVRLTIFRAPGSQSAPTLTLTGANVSIARMYALREPRGGRGQKPAPYSVA